MLWVIWWKKENKISQFGPLRFTFRLFNSEANDNSFQRMNSELAEQTSKMHGYRGKRNQPAWSVHNCVLERQLDLRTKFFSKFESPASFKKKVKALHLPALPPKGLESSFCCTSWWASFYALSGETSKKQALRARNSLELLFQALCKLGVPLLPYYCYIYYRFFLLYIL